MLAFAYSKADLSQIADYIRSTIQDDAVLWVAYPKKSSKKYRCDFDRNQGWEAFAPLPFEPVRQIAINEDWTALRWRNIRFFNNLNRRPEMLKSNLHMSRPGSTH